MKTKSDSKRRESREKALAALFQIHIGRNELNEAIFYESEDQPEDAFFNTLVKGISEHQSEIDRLIQENLEKWAISRIGNIELFTLRIATYELLYQKETPTKVVINEAIDIAKKFSDEKAGHFINSVLQKMISNHEKE